MEDLRGRSYLVTGAASGIGLAAARLLAERGARRLILVDRAAPPALAAPGCRVDRIAGDVADEALWAGLDLAGIDGAIVNAGVSAAARIVDLEPAEWRRVLGTNLDGAFLTLRAAMRALSGRPGAIVVTASASGIRAEPGTAAYAASKAGLIQLARVAAKEGAPQRLRVNAIAPGGVETAMWREVPAFRELAEARGERAAFDAFAGAATPLGRWATAAEIAAQIAFLLSDAAATITGAVLTSDGGYTL